MAESRIWYKYHFKVGNRIVHGGITTDLVRRGREHRCTWSSGHIRKIGRATTECGARQWEREHGY